MVSFGVVIFKVQWRNTMNKWFDFDFGQNFYTGSWFFFQSYTITLCIKWIMVFWLHIPFICGNELREIESSNCLWGYIITKYWARH